MSKTLLEIWDDFLATIRDNVSPQSYKTWFEPIRPVKLENNVLTIMVPSQFFYEWLEDHYITLLRKTVKKVVGADGKLEYSIVMESNYHTEKPYTVKVPTQERKAIQNPPVHMPMESVTTKGIRNPFIIPGLKKINIDSNLNPNYTFDNFIEGDCNRLARSAGFAVANNPGGTSFNPLLLYGGTGLGKTHLVNAIGIEIKKLHPNKTVLYVAAERFANQFVDAVKGNTSGDFLNFYQLIDVLILDDVHVLARKEKTQDVFFHIFNHLHQTGKQIILTSDKAPVDLEGMEQRLLSRFKWGLSADLQVPELETRIAIIHKKLYVEGIELPNDVVEYLAYSISSNVREIEGALISLMAQSSMNKKEITLELARNMIDKFVKNNAREISIDYIQKVVCDYFDLPLEQMKSKSRKREVVQARQLAMFFSKMYTKASLASIGNQCGGKDHATVLHACKTINNLIETDKKFKGYVDELEKKFNLA
jgi:chromosomal replication initiator protein